MAQADPLAHLTDDDLVRRALTGDERASDALWHRHCGSARGAIRRRLHCEDDAEDVLFEVRCRMSKKLALYRPGSHFRAWLCRMADNLARNAARSLARVPMAQHPDLPQLADGLADTAPSPECIALATCAHERQTLVLVLALRGLPPELSATAWLWWSGYQYAEIAEALAIPKGTVRSRLSSVRERLGRRRTRKAA